MGSGREKEVTPEPAKPVPAQQPAQEPEVVSRPETPVVPVEEEPEEEPNK